MRRNDAPQPTAAIPTPYRPKVNLETSRNSNDAASPKANSMPTQTTVIAVAKRYRRRSISLEDLVLLVKRLLRNTRRIEESLERFESAMEFGIASATFGLAGSSFLGPGVAHPATPSAATQIRAVRVSRRRR